MYDHAASSTLSDFTRSSVPSRSQCEGWGAGGGGAGGMLRYGLHLHACPCCLQGLLYLQHAPDASDILSSSNAGVCTTACTFAWATRSSASADLRRACSALSRSAMHAFVCLALAFAACAAASAVAASACAKSSIVFIWLTVSSASAVLASADFACVSSRPIPRRRAEAGSKREAGAPPLPRPAQHVNEGIREVRLESMTAAVPFLLFGDANRTGSLPACGTMEPSIRRCRRRNCRRVSTSQNSNCRVGKKGTCSKFEDAIAPSRLRH